MQGEVTKTLELFFDGDCPLCAREVRLLKRLDTKETILFTDIAGPDFNAGDYGRSEAEFNATIHARTPQGVWITGFEVFRQLYNAVGFGLLVRLTRIPGIAQMLEAAYRVFAANRLRLTGRCDAKTCSRPVGEA